jgi:class 3 adenylate cyclase
LGVGWLPETVELGTIYLVDLVGSTRLATSVGPAVSLGGFISVTLLVVALLVSRAAVRRLLSDTATAA